jgi:hypothetical protein
MEERNINCREKGRDIEKRDEQEEEENDTPLTLAPKPTATFLLKLPCLNKLFHPAFLNFPLADPTIFIE